MSDCASTCPLSRADAMSAGELLQQRVRVGDRGATGTEDGSTVRRRRECPQCGERFNTFETAELKLPAIVKSGDRREPFDEHKLRVSFERAPGH